MKNVTITLEYFPGYNVNPPCFTLNYIHPTTGKNVIKIVAKIPNGDNEGALKTAYNRVYEEQFELFTEGHSSTVEEHESIERVIPANKKLNKKIG